MVRTYSGLMQLTTYEDRFDYLKLWNTPHVPPDPNVYRTFLTSDVWKETRFLIRERDLLQDLSVTGLFIMTKAIVHHIDPITTDDIINNNVEKLLNPENLITTSIATHNGIHYKPIDSPKVLLERQPGDTSLW